MCELLPERATGCRRLFSIAYPRSVHSHVSARAFRVPLYCRPTGENSGSAGPVRLGSNGTVPRPGVSIDAAIISGSALARD